MNSLYGDIGRDGLVGIYGEEKVEWAEEYVKEHEDDYRDEMDANYP